MSGTTRVCLVGAGRAGNVHANSLSQHVPDAMLVAVVDPDPVVLNQLADQYHVPNRFTSLEDALVNVEFDAVVITVPTFLHRQLAETSAYARKHVFLEKPMALNLRECDAIINAAEHNKVHLQLGFMRRFDPEFVAAAIRIEAGEIGRPLLIKSLTHGPGLPPQWARDLASSNGMLAEVNSHDWDCLRWLMGSNPERVYAEVADFKGEARGVDTVDYYDHAVVSIRFQDGGLGTISGVCPCDYGYDARVEVIGEKGIMQIGEMRGQAVLVCTNRDQGMLVPIWRSWPQRFTWGYINEMRDFIACAQAQTPPRVGGEEGRWAVACVLAATRSFKEVRPVYLQEVLQEGI